MADGILGDYDPEAVLAEVGEEEFMNMMDAAAKRITRNTPLGPDESWDDPEEWTSDAVDVAHGWETLRRHWNKKSSGL